jgi:mono/diheme cytochrome c family protein
MSLEVSMSALARATVFGAMSLMLACSSEAPAPAPTPAPVVEATPAPAPEPTPAAVAAVPDGPNGPELYKTYCSSCHGETGKGDGVAAAALDPKPANFSDAAFWDATRTDDHLKKVIREGGTSVGKSPMMAPWGAVLDTDAKLDAVIAHIKTLKI